MRFILLALLPGVFPGATEASYDPTNDLLTAFGSQCPLSYGSLNSPALTQTESLKSIAQSMRDDTDCSTGVSAAMDSLISGLTISDLLVQAEAKATYNKTAEYCLQIESAMSNLAEGYGASSTSPSIEDLFEGDAFESADTSTWDTGDATLYSSLSYEFDSCRYSLYSSAYDADLSALAAKFDAASNLQTLTIELFSALDTSSKCLNKNVSIVPQIIGQVMVAGSALVGGTAGFALAGGGLLVDRLMAFMRNHKLDRVQKHLVDTSMMTALSCAIEAMASTYCEAKDQRQALLGLEEINHLIREKPAWQGVDLAQRHLTGFTNWLMALSSNSLSSTVVSYQTKILMERTLLATIPNAIKALENDSTQDIASNQFKYRQSAISSAISIFWSLSYLSDTQFFTLGSDSTCTYTAYFYTKGATRDFSYTSSEASSCNAAMLSKLGINVNDPPDFSSIKDAATVVIEADAAKLDELTKRYLPDPDENLSEATMPPTQGVYSPIDFMKETQVYLEWIKAAYEEELAGEPTQERRIDLSSRITKSRAVIAVLKGALATFYDPDLKSDAKVLKMSNILEGKIQPDGSPNSESSVRQGTTFLSTQIIYLVNQDIRDRIARNEISARLIYLLRYSAERTLSTLTTATTFDLSTAASEQQISQALYASQRNMDSLVEMFGKELRQAVSKTEKSTRKEENPALYEKALSHACLAISALPKKTAKKALDAGVLKHCRGRAITDPVTHLTLRFDDQIARVFDDRVCQLREYDLRASFLNSLKQSMRNQDAPANPEPPADPAGK